MIEMIRLHFLYFKYIDGNFFYKLLSADCVRSAKMDANKSSTKTEKCFQLLAAFQMLSFSEGFTL